MPKAPRPSTPADPNDDDRAGVVELHDVVDDVTWRVDLDELGPADDLICRKATGFPVSAFLNTSSTGISADLVVVLVWLARRKAGEPRLLFHTVAAQYGNLRQIGNRFTVDLVMPGGDDDDAEPDPT